jgi:threonine aldolase
MLWETGSIASLGGVVPRTLTTDSFGRMSIVEVENSIRWDDVHLPRSRLIHVENSYGNKHGYPLPPDYFTAIRKVADRHGLSVHMDGARLFNAAIAQHIDPSELVDNVDSVTFCLSKGLAAPVGSIVCGTQDFIARARRTRKSLGGGMRQAGILAAAGIVSLEEMVDRLVEDHQHARLLAEGLSQFPEIDIDVDMVRTNLVFFRLRNDAAYTADAVAKKLREIGNIWVGTNGMRGFRAVTHCWIGRNDVKIFLDVLGEILRD